MYDIIKPYMALVNTSSTSFKKTIDDFNTEEKVNHISALCTLENKDIPISELGTQQIEVLLRLYITAFDYECIRQEENKKISSSELYDYFIEWLNDNKIDSRIISYFSCPIFVKCFNKKHVQLRTSEGKFWKDITINDKVDHSECSKLGNILMGLVAYGEANIYIDGKMTSNDISYYLAENRSCGYKCDTFTDDSKYLSMSYTIKNVYDLIHPIKLIIYGIANGLEELQINGIEKSGKKCVLSIYSIKALLDTKVIKYENDSTIIDISDLPYFTTECYDIEIIITKSIKNIFLVKIISESIALDSNIRSKLFIYDSHHQITRLMKSYTHEQKKNKTIALDVSEKFLVETNSKQILATSVGITKGFYFKTDLESLKNIKFDLNGHTYFEYNKFMIDNICEKINDKLLYVPLNISEGRNNFTLKSFIGGINLSRIDSIKFILTYDEPQTSITIHNNGCGVLLYNTTKKIDAISSVLEEMPHLNGFNKNNYLHSYKLIF